MAKDNNLQDFLTDIADAIREKKGTTEKINPQDFATEIANLSSGGGSGNGSGTSGEGSALRYFDTSKMETNAITAVQYFSVILKGTINGSTYFIGAGTAMMTASSFTVSDCAAICTNAPMTFESGEILTFEEVCSKYNITNEMLAVGEITKEEFYNLEA